MLKVFEHIGGWFFIQVNTVGRAGIFLFFSLVGLFSPPYKIQAFLKQVYTIGSQSIFVIFFTAVFTGMVLGLQGYYTLSKFGSEGLLGSAVALSLIRELGPVLTALMVTARAGSAMCAEIGIMRISEQIDALECMAIDPFRYLIGPKFLAGVLSMPLLTSIFDVVGIMGGYLVGVKLLGVETGSYWNSMQESVVWQDIHMGIVKALFFGLIVTWVCTFKGFYVHLDREGFGAQGVSRATTVAVVQSSVFVLLWDYILTAILL